MKFICCWLYIDAWSNDQPDVQKKIFFILRLSGCSANGWPSVSTFHRLLQWTDIFSSIQKGIQHQRCPFSDIGWCPTLLDRPTRGPFLWVLHYGAEQHLQEDRDRGIPYGNGCSLSWNITGRPELLWTAGIFLWSAYIRSDENVVIGKSRRDIQVCITSKSIRMA